MINEQQISDVTLEVWSTMLEGEPAPAELAPAESYVSASVSISGAWHGTVLINCSTDLASSVACSMFELEREDLDDELISDAIGELANMIGGALKCLIPGSCTLSMPTVIKHLRVDDIRYPNQTPGATRAFTVGGQALRVVVLRGEGQPVSAVA
ncbi:MAG: chemotaxis protein CheX [Polyangiaceae bacterium]|nr:chemotaxis protein CheX [Myxococcales bacterium]MCB9590862.1 chemotaxis protein CheX [Polyangiaceae bacterium]